MRRSSRFRCAAVNRPSKCVRRGDTRYAQNRSFARARTKGGLAPLDNPKLHLSIYSCRSTKRLTMPERHQLTELQLAILRVIWDKGEATVQDIWEALHAERGLAQTTVATMLSRLERRGVVPRRAPPQSRQYHYKATVTEQEVQHSMVGELTERLFDGDVTALVQHLLTAEDVSPGDIARIRDMIERVETNAPETK